MREVVFGIVGAGAISQLHARSIAEIENVRLAGFYDLYAPAAEARAQEYGVKAYREYQDMLDDPAIDAIIIATPSGMHRDTAVMAAEAGKHIICEKPMEITVRRIDDIIEACDRNNVLLGGIFQMRFSEPIRLVREAMSAGRFGKMVLASGVMRWYRTPEYYSSSNWRGTWDIDGGGALMNQAVHMVDVLIHINGDVESVSAVAGTLSHDIEVEDNLCAVLKYRNGSFGTIEVSTSCAPGFPRRMEFSGVNGTVTFEEDKILRWEFSEPLEEDAKLVAESSQKESAHGGRTPLGISINGHKAQLEDFACAIREGRKPAVDGREARRAIELICAIYESAKSGKTVYL